MTVSPSSASPHNQRTVILPLSLSHYDRMQPQTVGTLQSLSFA